MQILFEIICYFLFFCTGELLIYLFSFGKKKPHWEKYKKASAIKVQIFIEFSFWLGAIFWGFLIFIGYRMFA